MRVLVFGDSIAYGAWDTDSGWVERIKRDAHSRTVNSRGNEKIQVINLGVGGDTSAKIVSRMPPEIKARHSSSWPLILVIAFGTNDQRSIGGKIEVPIEQFEENVKQIISIAKQYSDKIIFLGAPPLGEELVDFKGQEYSDERVKNYDAQLQSIVEENGLTYVPTRSAFESNPLESLFAYDNIHPNDKGHQLIAETIKPILEGFLSRG